MKNHARAWSIEGAIMKTTLLTIIAMLVIGLSAGALSAANFVIVNGDSAGEGLNDPTPVAPVGGNTGTTLGEQRLIVLEAVADAWAARIVSSVDIRILARFNSMGNCNVLGSTGPGDAFMNFPGAPVPNVFFHGAIADSITGVDQDPTDADFFITYNSDWDVSCATSFYYGLDGNEPAGTEDLFPVVLHEMGHGLGFASFVNSSTGVPYFGAPGIFDYYILDMTSGLHWTEMNNGQRAASAVNTGNLAWDGPNATIEGLNGIVFFGSVEVEVTSPPAIAGAYANLRAGFGGSVLDDLAREFQLVDTGSATPSDGCLPLTGFTPGNIALIDRGDCEFGVKALNAESAGASAAIIFNDRDGTVLVNMGGGVSGDQVSIPVVALSQDDGTAIKAELPGVNGLLGKWRPMLYAPTPVEPGSSVSHWDDLTEPDLLMEPFTSLTIFDELDLTPAQLKDVGHTVTGLDDVFSDDFESGNTDAWSTVVP